MARTPLARFFQKHLAMQELARAQGRSLAAVEEAVAQASAAARQEEAVLGRALTRRQLLGGGAAAMAGLALSPLARAARGGGGGSSQSVAIVGTGLSGLSAAMTLLDAGYAVTMYEASDVNVGGRTQSDKGSAQSILTGGSCGVCHDSKRQGDVGLWADGQVSDIFGEMIDTGHTTMIALANRFGLELVDSLAYEPAGSTETYNFFGSFYSKAQADADFAAMASVVQRDLSAAGYPTTYNRSKPGGRELDAMSIYDWIETRVPGGHRHPLGMILDVAYAIEFGADTTDQSALSLLYLLAYGPRNTFSVFGTSDERFRVRKGIGELPLAMAEYLGWDSSIRFGYWLESLRQNSDGRYTLNFAVKGGGSKAVTADIVLLTLPFAVLRNLDYSGAGFDSLKHTAIQELGRGVNGKLQLQFSDRYWSRPGPHGVSTGTVYSDLGFQNTWEPTRGYAGQSGILLKYTGGTPTTLLSQRHPYGNGSDSDVLRDAQGFLAELEHVFPGISPYWNGKVAGAMAHHNPRFGCSYSYWKVGQYQKFAGYEGAPQGNVFFAGEHCSVDFQGWMEGAARSGIEAGNAIVNRLRGR